MSYTGSATALDGARNDMLIDSAAFPDILFSLQRVVFSKASSREAGATALQQLQDRVKSASALFDGLNKRFPPKVVYVQWTDERLQNSLLRLFGLLSYSESKTVRAEEKGANKATDGAVILSINNIADASRAYYEEVKHFGNLSRDFGIKTYQAKWESNFDLVWVPADFIAEFETNGTEQQVEQAATALYQDTKTYSEIDTPTEDQTDAYLQSFAKQSTVLYKPPQAGGVALPGMRDYAKLVVTAGFVASLRKACKKLAQVASTIGEVVRFVVEVAEIAALALAAPAPSADAVAHEGTDAQLVVLLDQISTRLDRLESAGFTAVS